MAQRDSTQGIQPQSVFEILATSEMRFPRIWDIWTAWRVSPFLFACWALPPREGRQLGYRDPGIQAQLFLGFIRNWAWSTPAVVFVLTSFVPRDDDFRLPKQG